ncbi:hypothetical protein KYA53_001956, partial [Campylobacter jejuni]|nr:hypothetical protein [Campylobacter jejuni]EHT5470933.1 hypothetical protein [Campylobacter jejuni]EIZ9015853.1 hypothetical protein [Campylobacter jejuni]EKG4106532.1 hypothetical protein [Campylobacter jejuni]EKG5499805.1 hypothetical protein [Campylobacter jejuni]
LMGGLGVGQNYKQQTLSNNVTYTNTSNKPIFISVYTSAEKMSSNLIEVNGVGVTAFQFSYSYKTGGGHNGPTQTITNMYLASFFIVPPNATYKQKTGVNFAAIILS